MTGKPFQIFAAILIACLAAAGYCPDAWAGGEIITKTKADLVLLLQPNVTAELVGTGSDSDYMGGGLFAALLKDAGISYAIAGVPVRRADQVRQIRNACIAPMSEQWAISQNLKWVGPAVAMHVVLYHRPGLDRPVTDIGDVKGFKVGAFADGYAHRLLEREKISPELTPKDDLNFLKLEAGRIDYWLTLDEFMTSASRRLGKKPPEASLTLPPVEFGLVCNPDLDASVLEKLTRAVSKFRRDHRNDLPDIF